MANQNLIVRNSGSIWVITDRLDSGLSERDALLNFASRCPNDIPVRQMVVLHGGASQPLQSIVDERAWMRRYAKCDRSRVIDVDQNK